MAVLNINGKDRDFPAGDFPATLAELLEKLGVEASTVVAEVDGEIVEREKFAKTSLGPGARIELVRFVPGG